MGGGGGRGGGRGGAAETLLARSGLVVQTPVMLLTR